MVYLEILLYIIGPSVLRCTARQSRAVSTSSKQGQMSTTEKLVNLQQSSVDDIQLSVSVQMAVRVKCD